MTVKINPITKMVAVTPSDSTVLLACRALWVGVAGDLAVRFEDDPTNTITLTNVPVGLWPFSVVQVMAATTASGIKAGY